MPPAFPTQAAHRSWLAAQSALPPGFRCGCTRFEFVPAEVPKPARMGLTLIALDRPTDAFALMFTRNAFPGAPVIIGRRRQAAPRLGAVLVNNKISNVCAPGGVEDSERLCAETARHLGLAPDAVLPSSTGVIGWKLPVAAMLPRIPEAVAALQDQTVLTAAEGICTTDLFPKVRRAQAGAGSVVGIAKGAGMIEPNLATMLVYLLTDCDLPREHLRASLAAAVDASFNRMSIDSDTSTSDTVALLSSRRAVCAPEAFDTALAEVCAGLCEDVVRNGEGVHHVMRVAVTGAPSEALARAIGKSVVNSPLFQCAVCGNDPNVGRLVCAIGKLVLGIDLSRLRLAMGGIELFAEGTFRLDPAKERALVEHLKAAELYASVPPADGLTFKPAVTWPRHQNRVEITVDLGCGNASSTVLGADRSHEYISENADYRS